jgi:hypothetical protein
MATATLYKSDSALGLLVPTNQTFDVKPMGPFHSQAYNAGKVLTPEFDTIRPGFPQAKVPFKPWVPGVSTPEGMMIATGAGAMLVHALNNGGDIIRTLEGIATSVFVLVITGIPAGALWISSQVFPHPHP